MSDRPDNPLLPGRWYTAQAAFSGNYTKNSDFAAGREYRYCGSSHSHYDSATSLTFRERSGAPVFLWWEDGEPPSLLQERFGEPGAGFSLTPPKLFGIALIFVAAVYGLGTAIALLIH